MRICYNQIKQFTRLGRSLARSEHFSGTGGDLAMEILIGLLVVIGTAVINQSVALLFKLIPTKKGKKKSARKARQRNGRKSRNRS